MIEYDQGIHLKGTDLWFDSRKKTKLSFISSANVDRFVSPEKVISTPETIKLIEKRIKKSVVLACPYHRPFTLGNLQVELIPSGCMPGSSQIVINNGSKLIIYTGDLNLRQSLTSVPAHVKRCQILVLKCTYGAPKYTFSPSEEVIGSLIEFIDVSLSSGSSPVMLAETPGKAQEVMKILSGNGYKMSVHKSIYKAAKIYEQSGIELSNYEPFRPKRLEGKVLIFPPLKGESRNLEKIKNKRVALIIEAANDEISYMKRIFNADEIFPLSTHAGYDELLEFVEFVGPETVYLTHGYATGFARTLQKRGYEAIPLEKPVQLKLL
ncbi:MAG: MBL fold metallo-hydrolase [Deltaproteobacteria bacterium]